VARSSLEPGINWHLQDISLVGKVAEVVCFFLKIINYILLCFLKAKSRNKQLECYSGNWATLEIMKTLLKNQRTYKKRNGFPDQDNNDVEGSNREFEEGDDHKEGDNRKEGDNHGEGDNHNGEEGDDHKEGDSHEVEDDVYNEDDKEEGDGNSNGNGEGDGDSNEGGDGNEGIDGIEGGGVVEGGGVAEVGGSESSTTRMKRKAVNKGAESSKKRKMVQDQEQGGVASMKKVAENRKKKPTSRLKISKPKQV